MCTVVILRRPGQAWPLLLGANRDEMSDRPWRPPGRHWPDRPEVVGGLDTLAGGSWLGLNDHGVVAAALNRHGTLGPAEGRRSRGELVLEALDHADAAAAAEALADLNPRAYRPFNLVVADDRDAFLVHHRDDRLPVAVAPMPAGLSLVTAFDRDDPADPRIGRYRPLFERAVVPDPDGGDWRSWQELLACRDAGDPADARTAMCFSTPSGFATGSSALIALPTRTAPDGRTPVWLFAAGPPDGAPWRPVDLG